MIICIIYTDGLVIGSENGSDVGNVSRNLSSDVGNVSRNLSSDVGNVSRNLGYDPTYDEPYCQPPFNSIPYFTISTDKQVYSPNQIVLINPVLMYNQSCFPNEPVNIIVSKDNKVIESYLEESNPFSPTGRIVDAPGIYTIEGFTTSAKASTVIEVKDWYQTRYFFFLLIGIISVIGLMIVISVRIENYALQEVLRFSLTSGIVFSVMLSFVFIEEEIGLTAPVGLVRDKADLAEDRLDNDQMSSEQTSRSSEQFEWVINVGGTRSGVEAGGPSASQSVYIGGIQIPVFVVVFGIAGGYLRYLYEIASYNLKDRELEDIEDERIQDLQKKKEMVQKNKDLLDSNSKETIIDLERRTRESIKNDVRKLVFQRSIKDLSILFLSPLLAVAMYFILIQWQPTQTNLYLLAVVSFGTGLVTEEIVQLLIRIVQSVVSSTVTSKSDNRKENLEDRKVSET
jgi:hypothetical protein